MALAHRLVRYLNPKCKQVWDALKAKQNIPEREKAIHDFNAANKYIKRGMWMMPCLYTETVSGFQEKCTVKVNADGPTECDY